MTMDNDKSVSSERARDNTTLVKRWFNEKPDQLVRLVDQTLIF